MKLELFLIKKYVTPLTLKANVVYCFKGSCDRTNFYIGRTKIHLAVRVQEHLSGKSGNSAIHEHVSHARTVTLALSATFILYLKPTLILKLK